MLLVLDLPFWKKPDPEKYMEKLGISDTIDVITEMGEIGSLETYERVIYVTSLETGGDKYQRDFLREHDEVLEWFVLSEDTEEYLLAHFKNGVSQTKGKVFVSSDAEKVKEALKRPCTKRNSCLFCVKNEKIETEDFQVLMQKFLPDWTFERVCIENDKDALKNSNSSYVMIIGENMADFYLQTEIPSHIKPLLVVTGAEKQIHSSMEKLQKKVYGVLSGIDWGKSLQQQNFYLVSTLYENWRVENENQEDIAAALDKDERFVMWDAYGLPLPVTAYNQECVNLFLNQFDGCERIAERLKKHL